MFRPDAHGGEDGDGLGGFGQAAQEVKAFARQGGVGQAAFFGQCGKRQKAAAGADEAGQQGCGERFKPLAPTANSATSFVA